jgi:hypothetical protein
VKKKLQLPRESEHLGILQKKHRESPPPVVENNHLVFFLEVKHNQIVAVGTVYEVGYHAFAVSTIPIILAYFEKM